MFTKRIREVLFFKRCALCGAHSFNSTKEIKPSSVYMGKDLCETCDREEHDALLALEKRLAQHWNGKKNNGDSL